MYLQILNIATNDFGSISVLISFLAECFSTLSLSASLFGSIYHFGLICNPRAPGMWCTLCCSLKFNLCVHYSNGCFYTFVPAHTRPPIPRGAFGVQRGGAFQRIIKGSCLLLLCILLHPEPSQTFICNWFACSEISSLRSRNNGSCTIDSGGTSHV